MSIRRQLISWLSRKEVGATESEWRDIRLSFSQYGEDVLIQQILGKDDGIYLDIGANHPVRFSNTYHLYRFRGWHGLLVEPNPTLVKLLRSRRNRDVVLEAAVGKTDGTAFFEDNPEHTLSRVLARKDEARHPVRVVPVVSLPSLLDRFPELLQRVDFLNVDCEGMDWEILSGNDWQRCRPNCICAECGDKEEGRLASYLAEKGYRLSARAGHSRIFVLEVGDAAATKVTPFPTYCA